MSSVDDDRTPELVPPDSDELVKRLRNLEWPAVRPEVAERCWSEFSRRLSERDDDGARPKETNGQNAGRRLDFTRRDLPQRPAVAAYARTPALSGRASVRTASLTR
jgi:hypothetical protein